MILGTFAYCGSGQDTLADSFCELLGFKKYSMGDVIRDIANSRNLPCTREVLQNIRLEINREHGKEFVPKHLIELIKTSYDLSNRIVITGIRTIEEYDIFKNVFNMTLIFVYADEAIRYYRMLNRSEEKDEKCIQKLKINMARENEMFDYELLQKKADLVFNFNMPLEVYKKQERKIIEDLFQKIKENHRV